MGAFTTADEFVFLTDTGTLWSWPGQNPVRYRDPSGRCGPWCIGAVIGAGAATYRSWGEYQSGDLSAGGYAAPIAYGAATGALAAMPPSILGGALVGSAGSLVRKAAAQSFSGNKDEGKLPTTTQ